MSTTGSFNTKSPTIKRILREAAELSSSTSPDYTAAPLETNLFEWHFTLRGPPSTPYAKGIYHGRIVLPPSYPLRPPSFRFLTPSGRFEPNREICLSISGHHEESWQPAWGIRTALVAIRAFMEGDAKGQVGGVDTSREVRERLAEESKHWRCSGCSKSCDEIMQEKEREVGQGAENRQDETVPEELKLGYRDELGKENKSEANGAAAHKELVPRGTSDTPQAKDLQPTRTTSAPISDLPQAPEPSSLIVARDTASSMRPAATAPPAPAARTAQRQRSQDPTTWIDVAIGALLAAMAYMVIRRLAAWS